MAEDEQVHKSKLFEFCTQKINEGSKVKAFSDIIENRELINKNYELMQLYSPKMSINVVDKLRETLEDFDYEFNKTGLRADMTKDGTADANLDSLFQLFNKLVATKGVDHARK